MKKTYFKKTPSKIHQITPLLGQNF